MDGTTEDQYFEWLYSQVGAVRNRNPARSYWQVARQLHSTEFTWTIRNDENRGVAGLELRQEFVAALGFDPGSDFWDLGCSVFEMLVALARAADFQVEKSPGEWFNEFLCNISCNVPDSSWSRTAAHTVEIHVERLLSRTYSSTGDGGLFPLKNDGANQRRVEIWYQLSAYLLENYF